MASTLFLRCLHAPLFRLDLERTVTILGRSTQCDHVVGDRSISRQHAEIRIRNGRLHVKDLHSRNGTFVDGHQIQASEVSHGQVVRFGTVSFAVQTADEIEPCSDEETDGPAKCKNGKVRMAVDELLTAAQRRVFDLLLTGEQEKSIARSLELSQHTVHNHVRAILRAFDVHSRLELLAGFFNGNGRP
jgi:DNA-binding CsgD family transcriptional regulator